MSYSLDAGEYHVVLTRAIKVTRMTGWPEVRVSEPGTHGVVCASVGGLLFSTRCGWWSARLFREDFRLLTPLEALAGAAE